MKAEPNRPLARGASYAGARPVTIDFHSHLIPPAWGQAQGLPPSLYDVEALLEAKGADGLDAVAISNAMINMPGAPVDNLALDRIKEWIAYAADVVTAHAGRLYALGGINAFGGDAMLAELRTAVEGGVLHGVLVHSSFQGAYLDAPGASDFWAVADELGIPVFVHSPFDPAVGAGAVSDFRVLEFGARASDVALSVAGLILGGVLERHERVRVVCANAGGGLAMLLGRLEAAYELLSGPDPQPPRPPSAYLERVYVDTCSYSAAALRCNLDVFGAGNLVFGTDYPPMNVPVARTMDALDELGLSDAEREAVLGGTARALLGVADA